MAFFGKIFGGGNKKNAAPTPQEAIQKLRETEALLVKKQEFLENKINQEIATARKHGTKNKRAALIALKRKKQYERQLQQIDGTLSTIEFQREAVENASTNTEVLSTMGEAAKALKSAHKNMKLEDVEMIMEEIDEQQQLAKEISDVIANPMGFGQNIDEDELLAELEELEQEELDKQMLDVGPTHGVKLPTAPIDELPSKVAIKKKEDDNDLAELQAWAAN